MALLACVALASACARPDPSCQGRCDPAAELCLVQLGCAFLQNGNPSPFGEADRYQCAPLAPRCLEAPTCACVQCTDQPQADDCQLAGSCEEPVDDGPVLVVHGCE